MWKKTLYAAIPTLIAGIAMMTLAAPQKSGVSLNLVKMTAAKASSHAMNHTSRHNPNKAARTNSGPRQSEATSTDHTLSYGYGWYRGYHGYRSYRGYRGYYGWRSYRSYYGHYSHDGNDDEPDQE
jgi:hypothetical protein